MQDFRKLQVWEKSHDLTVRRYELTSQFPVKRYMGLQAKSVAPVPRFRQTSPRAVAGRMLLTLHVFFR